MSLKHWSEKYVGLLYQPGVFDCGVLCEQVQQAEFGRSVTAPKDRDYYNIPEGDVVARFKAMSSQVSRVKDQYAQRTESPSDGDAVLLVTRGYMQHLGIYCLIQGEAYVLHASESAKQVVLHKLSHLVMKGLKVEGFYKWL